MLFGEIIRESSIDLHISPQSKEDVLRHLVHTLLESHPGIDPKVAESAVLEREFALSTGVGQGVAVPHATLQNLDEPLVGFGRCDDGIDFGSMDGQPVKLLFLLLAPENAISLHLKLLSRISRLCNNTELRETLLTIPTAREVIDLIRKHESAYREL